MFVLGREFDSLHLQNDRAGKSPAVHLEVTMAEVTIDPLSLASVRLELFRKDHVNGNLVSFGPASGFIIKPFSRYYLITNWHVLTGKNAETEQPLSTQEPFRI